MSSLARCPGGFMGCIWLGSCILQRQGDSKWELALPSWDWKKYAFYFGPKNSHLGKFNSVSDLHLLASFRPKAF